MPDTHRPDAPADALSAHRLDGRFDGCRPAREIAADVRSGAITAEDAVAASIARIRRRNGEILAFGEVWADRALADARALDADPRKADLPLAGVPFAVKENTEFDNPVVTRLVERGAIPVGTTMTPQFCGWGTTDSQRGVTANPVHPGRTPGGSSGGSAAAVAAGMVPFAQGNDGMGSLRIPAACCELSTIKATPGIVPGHVGGNNWYGMSVQGVLAQDNEDLVLLMRELTDGHVDAVDAPLPERFSVVVDVTAPIAGISAGARWEDAARLAARHFEWAGLPVEERRAPYPLNPLPMLARWSAGVADSLHADGPVGRMEERSRLHARIGDMLRGTIKDRQVVRAASAMEAFLPGDGILITPALAAEPPKAAEWHKRSWVRNMASNMTYTPYVSTWNLLGFPAGVVVEPSTGVPVQVVARRTQERVLLTAMQHIADSGIDAGDARAGEERGYQGRHRL
ncbi:amidase family protein [Corynebacterium sp. 335C]